MSGGEFDSRTPVYFDYQSRNHILLDLTITLLLLLGTVTNVASSQRAIRLPPETERVKERCEVREEEEIQA